MKYADVMVGETYRAQIAGTQTMVKVVRATEREGRKVFAVLPAKGGAETLLTAAALHLPTPAAPAEAQPDALGQIVVLLRNMAERVLRAALLRDLAAHGRSSAGADAQGLAAELRPLEERANKLLEHFADDLEQATRLANGAGLLPAVPTPEVQPSAAPAAPATPAAPMPRPVADALSAADPAAPAQLQVPQPPAAAPAQPTNESEGAQLPTAPAEPAQSAGAKVRLQRKQAASGASATRRGA